MPNLEEAKLIEHWLTQIENEGVNLTKWEEDFIESIRDQWDKWKSISPRQKEILERIYSDKTP